LSQLKNILWNIILFEIFPIAGQGKINYLIRVRDNKYWIKTLLTLFYSACKYFWYFLLQVCTCFQSVLITDIWNEYKVIKLIISD
jgi:hypothetical protein